MPSLLKISSAVLFAALQLSPGLALAQSACASSPVYAGPPMRSAPESVWRKDFSRSIDGELPTELQKTLGDALDKMLQHVPAASVAVAIPGEGMWSATRGMANKASSTPVVADQAFQVASTAKTFTATVVLQLVGEGKLKLGDSIDRWFPDAPNARLITIEQLLRHTNGLVSFNALPSFGTKYRPPAEIIALGTAQPPQFCPGTGWSYTNTGYAMLGVIVEKIEGMPLSEVLAKRLLQPLSLSRTVMRRPGVALPVVAGHSAGRPVDDAPDQYATPYAAGALASTAGDLVHFWHALLAGQVLPTQTVRRMFTDMPPMLGPYAGSNAFYGMGVQLYDVPDGPGLMLGHSGGIEGFTSIVAYVPADDVYIAVAFNEKNVPAEAGLWALLRALRAYRVLR
ncbi:serine hydrolase domain-containing protein [Variovorax sp. PAMC26660]|uniref:serine hydrolase domain-containing protein n=1 Tax=Variovorax sp. PAMC26660 TaxID=2762322 RepID=UPI00164E5E03|nr:serine hydrolase domain-containing protein [Variovorax sp. PAMC26660]QNK68778.1 beta-lactamase family protein [Variovorax sp. PAMC26660]